MFRFCHLFGRTNRLIIEILYKTTAYTESIILYSYVLYSYVLSPKWRSNIGNFILRSVKDENTLWI